MEEVLKLLGKKNYKSNMKNNELKEYLDDEKNITKISYQKILTKVVLKIYKKKYFRNT